MRNRSGAKALIAALAVATPLCWQAPGALAQGEAVPAPAPTGAPGPAPTPASPAPVTPSPVLPVIAPSSPFGYQTAGKLADRCTDAAAASTGYCFAYIAAVHDAVRAYEVWLNQREFCAPAGLVQSDLRRAFLAYVSAYPTARDAQAASVIVVALKQTYPCPVAQPVAPVATPVAP